MAYLSGFVTPESQQGKESFHALRRTTEGLLYYTKVNKDNADIIDVSGGEKIPRKGGPGITKSDFLVINKADLSSVVGASLEIMDKDTAKMREKKPWSFTEVKNGKGLEPIYKFIIKMGGLQI